MRLALTGCIMTSDANSAAAIPPRADLKGRANWECETIPFQTKTNRHADVLFKTSAYRNVRGRSTVRKSILSRMEGRVSSCPRTPIDRPQSRRLFDI